MAGNVREINRRIGNIRNIRQITKAMNAIAMTKVTRFKRRLEAAKPWTESLERLVAAAMAQPNLTREPHPLVSDNGAEPVAVLVLNSDSGLCGRYTGDLNRATEKLIHEHGPAARLLVGGEKARLFFARQDQSRSRPVETLETYVRVYSDPTMDIAGRISRDIIRLYNEQAIGRCIVVSMRFVSDLRQRLQIETLLPIEVAPRGSEALIEPSGPEFLDRMLPLYVQGKLFEALLHTRASEEAIRRQSMKSATDNADDLITLLTRTYNKARQQGITTEIADIVGGSEALRNA
ncbi:ATP synthase F1 subunit gamma [Candidatus Bipolaricaulota bacterium]|nr:ATP synthase F1 subunit gamma [Candidatus Bipolaricaulota bacterium]